MISNSVSNADFREIADFVRRKSGIQLDDTKLYLIETRLGPLLREFSMRSYLELCRRAASDARVLSRIIDEISTNETSFFRDRSPFELLKYKLIPDVVDRQRSPRDSLKIWSAASSTGQEVYTIAMCCAEVMPRDELSQIRIVGTDISDRAVRSASMATYTNYEVGRGLPDALRNKYMRREGANWRFIDELRALVSFKQANLLESCRALGSFDIIFCRNVAIYFDLATRKSLFERLAQQLKPGGALVIGSSETLHGVTERFQRKDYLKSAFYTAR